MNTEPGERGLQPRDKKGSFLKEPQKLLLSENSRLRGLAEEDEEDCASSACVMSVSSTSESNCREAPRQAVTFVGY